MNFGDFEILPKCLKLWFFARFHPYALEKLRVNKSLKEFIDNEVKLYMKKTVENILEIGESNYKICDIKVSCKCSHNSINGCVIDYFKNVVPYNKTRVTSGARNDTRENRYTDTNAVLNENDGVYTYSFALYPEEYQPSGTINRSTLNDYLFEKDEDGICFRCILLNGFPKNNVVIS